jgi:adenylate kinase
MRLILIGPPGSGKGTQAKLLSKRLHLVHIGTGDILREAIRAKTPLGTIAEPFILRGELVPDDLVNEVIAERFRQDNRPDCFVTDGYPRTVAQAAAFDLVLRQQFLDLTGVLFLLVEDEEIVRRMTGRWSCPKCKSTYHLVNNPPRKPGICDVCGTTLIQRADDREATVRERLKQYHKNTEGLLNHYRSRGLLHEVHGIGTIDEIYDKIVQELKQAKPTC